MGLACSALRSSAVRVRFTPTVLATAPSAPLLLPLPLSAIAACSPAQGSAPVICGDDGLVGLTRPAVGEARAGEANTATVTRRISSKMLGGASQIVSMIRVKCNGK